MRITRLQLRDLGRHRELDLELAPGFTIIRGPNEAGKTTIQRGLEIALFRKPTATAAELEALRSWGANEDDRSVTRLEFVVDDEKEDGAVESRTGVLEKEFRGSRGTVSLEYDGQTYGDPARADEVVAGLTGIPTEAFFRSTASIRHQELDDLDRDEGALRDRLQASIGGGDRGSSRAKTRLEDALRALKARGEKNPGRLKIAEEAVARAEQALKSGEALLQRLESDRDQLAQARDGRLRAEKELNESRNLLELARQAERLRTDRAVVQERYERYRQAADAQRRLTQLESMPERPVTALREHLDRMRTLQSRVTALQETLHSDVAPPVEPDVDVPSYLGQGVLTALLTGLGLVLIAVGLSQAVLTMAGLGGLMILVGLVFATQFWERRKLAVEIDRLNRSRERDRTIRRQTRVGTEEGLRVAQSGVANILRELGVPDIATAESLLVDQQSRHQEIATLQVQVGALLAGQSPDQVEALRDRAASEIEQKASALESLGPLATDARARERLEAEARERHTTLERTRDAEAAAAARVDANPVDAEQVAGEAERLTIWREQLAALQRRVRVYEKTLALIQAAESGTMRKATRFLERQIGRDIARLTAGRYKRIAIDDQTLDISVFAPEKSAWVPASRLSKGTVDQIFLAARIGLVRLVTQGRRPPLILDDPFSTFDDARASRAAIMLRELSSDFQVIYLACSSRYDGLADKVITLQGPTETDAQPDTRAEVPAVAAPAAVAEPEPEPAPEPEPTPEPELAAEAEPGAEPEPAADTTPTPAPEPELAEPNPEPEPAPEPELAADAEPGPEPPAEPEPGPEPPADPEPAADPTPTPAPEPASGPIGDAGADDDEPDDDQVLSHFSLAAVPTADDVRRANRWPAPEPWISETNTLRQRRPQEMG